MPHNPANRAPLTLRELDAKLWDLIGNVENFGLWHRVEAEDNEDKREALSGHIALAHVGLGEGARALCREVGELHELARYAGFPDE